MHCTTYVQSNVSCAPGDTEHKTVRAEGKCGLTTLSYEAFGAGIFCRLPIAMGRNLKGSAIELSR